MPRQHSSSLPRESSVAGSSSRVRYHSGRDSRQTIYPELRERRIVRSPFSLLLKEVRNGEASEAARHSSERQAVMPPPTPEAGQSEFGYSCGPGRSFPSMADFSDSELDPQDSISNRGSSVLDDSHNTTSKHLPGWCNLHCCYMSGEFFDPKYRAWMQVIRPRVRVMRPKYYRSSSLIVLSIRDLKPVIVTS